MSHRTDRRPRPDPALQVGTWLAQIGDRDTPWHSLWPSLERQAALQADTDRFCSDVRCGRTLVRQTGQQQLAWFAATPSQAAKMRNLRASFEAYLTKRGWDFSAVSVRIQPAKNPRTDAPSAELHPPSRRLTKEQLAAWRELEAGLAPSSLRSAVTQLIAHHDDAAKD